MQMPMYGSPMGYNQPYGGWQAPQQLYQPQTNSFMPKAQNAPDGLNQGYGSMPWIFVSSEEDARNRIVQPSQTAWFMDNNNPYFYVKSCDVSGAVTFKKFKFSEISGELGQYATAASQQDILFGQHFGQINDCLTNIGNGVCSLGNNGVIIGSAGCPCVCNDAAGYYSVSVNTTLVASAAGPVTVTLYQDGQAVSGATQTVTAAAADSVGIAFTAPVRVYRGQVSSRLQVIVTGQAVTTSNVAVEVVKE